MTKKLLEAPPPHHVDIWYRLTAPLGEADLAQACAVLSADERKRQERLRLPEDRRDYAFGRALLRTSLSRYSGAEPRAWTFETEVNGTPELSAGSGAGISLVFGLSHTRGLVACAITSGTPVGVDVEHADPSFDYTAIASRYLTHHEIRQIDSCPPLDRATRFFEIWSLKEAYAKATRRGLFEGMRDTGFQIEGDRIHLVPPVTANPGAWQFMMFAPEPGYRIAAAVAGRRSPVWTLRPVVGRSSKERRPRRLDAALKRPA
jgi:4'-phosphopantetheinyl transferase